MMKLFCKSILILGMVILISPITRRIIVTPLWITLLTFVLWVLLFRLKLKHNWLIFIVLIPLNFYVNRLLSVNINPVNLSFDREQSFLSYTVINNSIGRYQNEGLWIMYSLRSLFYSNYLILFSWVSNILKILSLSFWIKILGFSGTILLILGLINFFKKNINFIKILSWIIVILITSSLRVLGDSNTYILLLYPVLFYFVYLGTKSIYFIKYYYIWFLFFVLDIILL
jgi:hypothetical protein